MARPEDLPERGLDRADQGAAGDWVEQHLLPAAVAAVGGRPRAGQEAMARAVAQALVSGEHLLVQAGTGTGKSLGYLVPVVAHAVLRERPVVISTATLALQNQVVERDLPRVAQALAPSLGRMPTWQLVKGRRNYLCRHRLDGGYPSDDPLFDLPGDDSPAVGEPADGTRLGGEVVRLREWAEQTDSGDRDAVVPGVSDRAWRQVSVSAEDCLGAARCPSATECFSERARGRAREVDVIVANHALIAIDAFEGRALLPEHDVLVVDEAHELADRVTSVISDELTPTSVRIAARRARRAGAGETERLDSSAAELEEALAASLPGRLARGLPSELATVVEALRDGARQVLSTLSQRGREGGPQAGGEAGDGSRQLARSAVTEVFDVAERLAAVPPEEGAPDVVWVSRYRRADGSERTGLHVAPLSVAGLVRERLLADRCTVLTSATLALGGTFDAAAGNVGLRAGQSPAWRSLDVGSPFDYPRQGILYLARHLPAPGREGLAAATLDEIEALINAAGGRTLGLFSSRRAAEEAAAAMRERLDGPVLCQGDDVTPTLLRRFAADAPTCLFGTLSLWQGVDVPGPSCQLVLIDRIPFPRPDDPLSSARQQAVARAGGNGFMAVAATHAALRLAQGAGRLIRGVDDRGVVAVLDSRLATARYGSFLRASLPPFWVTHDREIVLAALSRIDVTEPVPVQPVPVGD